MEATRAQIEQWEKVQRELTAVRDRLATLPDKTRHAINVPIGMRSGQQMPFAFMPGYIQHTNEVLVLLGDNWFAERSAKDAAAVAQRRIDKCSEMIGKFRDAETNKSNWAKFMGESGHADKQGQEEEVEIVEEYNEEAEREWREQHRQRVRERKQREALERQLAAASLDDRK